MPNPRTYGRPPFHVAVIHGGPGAAGEMAPVARRLATGAGVLEPTQTARSLEGQVEELKILLENHGEIPLTLIGFSWGAWLSFIVTARNPGMISKLVLVGSGPFEEKPATSLHQTRLDRLDKEERAEFDSLIRAFDDSAARDQDRLLARLGTLASKADSFDPIGDNNNKKSGPVQIRADIYQPVWRDVAELRRSGKLLDLAKSIQCPVVAIHGDYDPHPAEGVQRPLSAVLKNFRFILLKDCGHRPWMERRAKEKFYRILGAELG